MPSVARFTLPRFEHTFETWWEVLPVLPPDATTRTRGGSPARSGEGYRPGCGVGKRPTRADAAVRRLPPASRAR